MNDDFDVDSLAVEPEEDPAPGAAEKPQLKLAELPKVAVKDALKSLADLDFIKSLAGGTFFAGTIDIRLKKAVALSLAKILKDSEVEPADIPKALNAIHAAYKKIVGGSKTEYDTWASELSQDGTLPQEAGFAWLVTNNLVNPKSLPEGCNDLAEAAVKAAIPPPPPPAARTNRTPPATFGGLMKILKDDRKILPVPLRLNQMSGAIEAGDKEIDDAWNAQIREKIEDTYAFWTAGSDDAPPEERRDHKFSKNELWDAAVGVADLQKYHPAKAYLNKLPAWSGTSLMGDFITNALKITAGKNGITQARVDLYVDLWRRFMIGCVARVMQPGCKLDTVLALYGKQGRKKSSVFQALVPEKRLFSDEKLDFDHLKDTVMSVHNSWISEAAELETLLKYEHGAVKAFLSKSHDNFRRPYEKANKVYRRSFVIVASANVGFLADLTGNRRYWPIVLGDDLLDLMWVEKNRDQLWAEALHLYNLQTPWWFEVAGTVNLEPPELDVVRRECSVAPNAFAERVQEWLSDEFQGDEVTSTEVYLKAICGEAHVMGESYRHLKGQGKADVRAVTEAIQQAGWSQDKHSRKFIRPTNTNGHGERKETLPNTAKVEIRYDHDII